MNTPNLIRPLLVAATLLGGGLLARPAQAQTKPNIVVILADDISPVGDYQTPNRFKGTVEHVSVSPGKLPGDEAASSAEND